MMDFEAHDRAIIDQLTDRIAELEGMLERMRDENSKLIQETGDAITNVFEQMVKGKWRDELGHDVRLNIHMLKLKDIVLKLMETRAALANGREG